MIVPTRKLVDFIEKAESQNAVADTIGIDKGLFSKILRREQGASARIMERVHNWCHWPIQDLWEIVDGDGADES